MLSIKKMDRYKEKIKLFLVRNIFLIIILIFASSLRIWNLGYSDFQGDEIKAFFRPEEGQSALAFLLDQRKGPNQFLITWLFKDISSNYENYFLIRLPFAVAGILSVLIFYLIVRKLLGEKIAFFSSIFFATNGFLIAFSRIVQYQSFVIFLGLLSIYLYILFREKVKFWYLYLSFFSLAMSILFHYDGVFFGIFLGLLVLGDILLIFWRKKAEAKFKRSLNFASISNSLVDRVKKKSFIINLTGSSVLFIASLALFYIPFVLNISQTTLDYWSGRITGDVSGKISSSYYLFTVYQPIYAVHFYVLLTALGTAIVLLPFVIKPIVNKLPRIKLLDFFVKIITPNYYLLGVLSWATLPFIFLEFYVSIPGTHIYTYLIPMTILMGTAISTSTDIVDKIKYLKGISILGVFLLGIFLFLQSWTIFVDHSKEYPWQEDSFLVFHLFKPTPIFHLSMFGFPYQRGWQEVGEFINDKDAFYTSNERVSITRYYVNLPRDGKKIGYYIFIRNPQSFSNEVPKGRIQEWILNNPPVKEIKNPSGNETLIYLLPEINIQENYN